MSDSKVVEVLSEGSYTLVFTFDAGLTRALDVRVTSVHADYRIPLYLGIALAVIGALMSRELRSKLKDLNIRFGR